MNWRLSPSDLTFLFEDCPNCFYLKVKELVTRPRTPMPKIFTQIDASLKRYLAGKRSEDIAVGMPSGIFSWAERWVESAPLAIPERFSTCYLRGRFDNLLQLDRG